MDADARAVYAAEDRLLRWAEFGVPIRVWGTTWDVPRELRFPDLAAARRFCDQVCAGERLPAVGVRHRQGDRKAHYSDGVIALPSWGLRACVCIHELAHHAGHPHHDAAFRAELLRLLHRHLHPTWATMLRLAFADEALDCPTSDDSQPCNHDARNLSPALEERTVELGAERRTAVAFRRLFGVIADSFDVTYLASADATKVYPIGLPGDLDTVIATYRTLAVEMADGVRVFLASDSRHETVRRFDRGLWRWVDKPIPVNAARAAFFDMFTAAVSARFRRDTGLNAQE